MIDIKLPDGKVVQYPEGITPIEVARGISEGLARNVISARFNNRKVETVTPLMEDGDLILYTWKDEEGKKAFWHSSSHVVAQALEELYPGIRLTIGPAIDSGFYYDVDFGDHTVSEKDFPAIEKRAMEIARGKHDFKMREVSKADALAYYQKQDNPFKVELIENLEDGDITFCDHDTFTDLCRGGAYPEYRPDQSHQDPQCGRGLLAGG